MSAAGRHAGWGVVMDFTMPDTVLMGCEQIAKSRNGINREWLLCR